ncbi:MAG: hypothetical protein CSA65_08130 [Proteobacteria bacterium]|nr:MAG: hypothetical protein CSB49_00415 [Pseudomonadota bacterium]PIE17706.1 MAG: hypothetical protein CSA65_08130 [Pseudomonadota bacterium]
MFEWKPPTATGGKREGVDVDDLLAQYLNDDQSPENKGDVRSLTDELEALLVAAERNQIGPQRQRVTPTEALHVVQTETPSHDEFDDEDPTEPLGTQLLPTVAEQEFDAPQTTYRGKRSARALIRLPDRAARRMRNHGVGARRAPAGRTQPTGDNRCDVADQRGDERDVGQRSRSTPTYSGPSRVLSCRADVVAEDMSHMGGTANALRPQKRLAVLYSASGGRRRGAPKPASSDAEQELAQDAPTATILPTSRPGDDEGDDLAPPDDGRQTLPGWSPDDI